MEQYETLFSLVYQDLKGRIVTGQLPAGSDFPSIQRLRQEYQIGFRTAKEVTVRLREDGYIASRDRKPPQVCWEGGMPAALAVLSHRGHLSELYDALAVVMPLLSSFASQTCDMRLLPCYEQTKRAMHRRPQCADNWQSASCIFPGCSGFPGPRKNPHTGPFAREVGSRHTQRKTAGGYTG